MLEDMSTREIIYEVIGYIGTGVVLLSFIMTDMKWMRGVNMIGGFISLVYALIVGNMPVVVLNASLITINGIQLIRAIRKERKSEKEVKSDEVSAYDNKKEEIEVKDI